MEKPKEFKCGLGQKRLSEQADEMGYFLENGSEHQDLVNSVTTLFEKKLLLQEEAAAVYSRAIKAMLKDLRQKSSLIVQKNEIVIN